MFLQELLALKMKKAKISNYNVQVSQQKQLQVTKIKKKTLFR